MSVPVVTRRLTSPVVLNYGIAALSVAVAVAADLAFNRLSGGGPADALLLCAIVLTAWIGGTGPALLATALAILAIDYFFLQPEYSLALQLKNLPRLVLFAAAALFVVSLSATRRRAEERGRQAERELRLTVDTIPVLAARYRPDGSIEFRNKNWRDYTGLSQDNLEGHRWGGALHPDDVEMVVREWRAHIATGEPFDLEQRLRRADGEYRWHWVRRVPLHGESGEVVKWYGVAFDIDDRKRAEHALRQSEAELAKARHESQLIIDTVPVLMLRHRADGIIDFVNQVGRDYSGRSTTKWTTRTSIITHPDDVSRLEAAWDVALATGEPFETEARLRRADGEYRWFATRRVPLRDADGEVIAWYAATYDIEDRKRAEDALRQSEAALLEARHELQLIIDTIPALVVRHRADGIMDFVNQTWRGYTGLSQAAWKARGSVVVHPDDLDRVEQVWLAHLKTGEAFETEQRLRNADGEYRWHFLRRVPLRNDKGEVTAWYGAAHDIEDRRRAEDSLRRREAELAAARHELQLMIDTIVTMIVVIDINGKAYFANRPAQEFVGKDLPIENVRETIHPDDRAMVDELWRTHLVTGEPFRTEQRMRRADGQYRWCYMTRVPQRDESGKIVRWYGSGYDIHDRKLAEDALRAAQAALAHANRAATLGEISASIAHEVNQPLAAIVANGQACLRFLRRETPDLNDVRGAVEWIVKDGNRAGEVIQRVRGLLKKADAQKAPLDVNDTINEVAALLQQELAAQHVLLQLELAPAIPLTVADRVQLQQVIINLVMNGAEAMQAVTERRRALVVQSHRDEANQVVVAVTDSGVGIPAETAARLFDAFFSTKPSGLGIGLSICRSIIADHGGRIWAEDNGAGPGATFRFALPPHQNSAM
jgi:PAS domain S-box-containing protein